MDVGICVLIVCLFVDFSLRKQLFMKQMNSRISIEPSVLSLEKARSEPKTKDALLMMVENRMLLIVFRFMGDGAGWMK